MHLLELRHRPRTFREFTDPVCWSTWPLAFGVCGAAASMGEYNPSSAQMAISRYMKSLATAATHAETHMCIRNKLPTRTRDADI